MTIFHINFMAPYNAAYFQNIVFGHKIRILYALSRQMNSRLERVEISFDPNLQCLPEQFVFFLSSNAYNGNFGKLFNIISSSLQGFLGLFFRKFWN